LHIVIIKVILL